VAAMAGELKRKREPGELMKNLLEEIVSLVVH
jgi:hypothetical protein